MTPHSELRKEIENASVWADAVFADVGEILPMWHAVGADGTCHIIPQVEPNKDFMAQALRAFCEDQKIVRLLFISEAWTSISSTPESAKRAEDWIAAHNTLETYPERDEMLIFQGEDENGMIGAARKIIRVEGKKPTLGPLEWHEADGYSGRYTGLLPRKGSIQ